MPLPFDHTHDLDLQVARSEFKITLSQEWDGQLTWNKRDCESSSHGDDTDLSVTVVCWVDVPDSDRGDFWRRRAVDISSFVSDKDFTNSSCHFHSSVTEIPVHVFHL